MGILTGIGYYFYKNSKGLQTGCACGQKCPYQTLDSKAYADILANKKIPSYTEEINPDNGYLIKNGIIQNTTDNILTITTENLNYKASQTYAIIVEFWINNK